MSILDMLDETSAVFEATSRSDLRVKSKFHLN